MNDAMINGVFLLVATGIGGALTMLATRIGAKAEELKNDNKKLRETVRKLLRQIEAYHKLEDLYAMEISSRDSGKAVRTIKVEFRDRLVEATDLDRPRMTANQARKHLDRINED